MSIRKEPLPSQLEGGATGSSSQDRFGDVAPANTTTTTSSPQNVVWARLEGEVDAGKVRGPLAAFSFMTGFMDAVSFSAIFVWCGFQTGNFVQLSIAASRLFGADGGGVRFRTVDQQALASLISFNVGASLGRIGDKMGACRRLWLVAGTLAQAVLTLVAAVAIWKSEQPSASKDMLSFVCIACMSASLGLQGIMAKRLNTPFGTTVVLTTIWCELVSDATLFDRRRISSRDDKIFAIICIFFDSNLKNTSLIDTDKAIVPLAAFSFMTGFIDAITFSAIFVWCGFQTGNFVQLALAIAHLFSRNNPTRTLDTSFHLADQQALTSLLSFNLGASLGRIGDRIGPSTRLWLFSGTLLQALFTAIASITIWQSHQPTTIATSRAIPAWSNSSLSFLSIAFASASLGLQGVMSKRLNSPFGTTIVLTTIWCELVADPMLFARHRVPSRDLKLIGALSIFIGAFTGRALADNIGAAGAFGVGAGLRLLVALSWLFVPSKQI